MAESETLAAVVESPEREFAHESVHARGWKLGDGLQRLGYGSSKRYVLKNLLKAGRVFVDGVCEKDPSRRMADEALIRVLPNEAAVAEEPPGKRAKLLGRRIEIIGPTLLVYNKPCGLLTALSDRRGAPHIGDSCRALSEHPGLHPVGRLDQHSCGLLLLTNDGHFTKKLIDRQSNIPRVYCCVVTGCVCTENLSQRLESGVETRFGKFFGKLLSAAAFEGAYEHQKCAVDAQTHPLPKRNDGPNGHTHVTCSQSGCDDDKNRDGDGGSSEGSDSEYDAELAKSLNTSELHALSEVRVQLVEGQKREVRRMLAYCGHTVLNLRRESYGPIMLDSLRAGEIREATPAEIGWALSLL